MSAQLIPLDLESLKKAADPIINGQSSLLLSVQNIEVNDEQSFQEVMALRNEAASREKKLHDFFEPARKAVDIAKKTILAMRDEMMRVSVQAKVIAQQKADTYLTACQVAKAEADKRAEQLAAQERRRLAIEADKLMGQGKVAEAESLQLQAEVMKAPILPSALPQADNTRIVQKWKGEVTDVVAFLKAIVDGKRDLMYEYRGQQRAVIVIDEAVLNDLVSRHGPALKWPGLVITETVKAGARKL